MLMIDRRSLVLTAGLGLGALTLPGVARADEASGGFLHGVASGEPGPDTMLFWTRFTPRGDAPVEIRCEVSDRADFARIVAGGAEITGPWRDWTVKITVDGLTPGAGYFYRFVGPAGSSPVGRTRTLPADDAQRCRIGIFSCSNMGFGWFNAYGHAAARSDLDLTLHLGDYLYEQKLGDYPGLASQVAGRAPEPLGELLHLADYRLRHACYRRDPDLQALTAARPLIAQWDDHESANDSWEGGAQNHQPDEGDWSARKAAAIQAYREWMPVSDEPWKAYDIGRLATLFRTETRLLARTRQPDLDALFRAADPAAALARFRDGPWHDPAATMMGSQQEAWLAHALARSVSAGQRWQVVGVGTIIGHQNTPRDAMSWLSRDARASTRRYIANDVAAAHAGLPANYDSWGGYPAARARFLGAAQAAGADLVVVSGDSHNAWAFDLGHDGRPAGVEFAGHSVTSPGYESGFALDPRRIARDFVAASDELKWCDTARRGYMALTIEPDRVGNAWVMVDDVRRRGLGAGIGHRVEVRRGRRMMTAA